ncbi:MAG: HAD family hydrolase [Phycisphaerae bacterium]
MSTSFPPAVVFDLDDTLYPEREYAFSGFDAVAAAFEDQLGDRRETAALMRQLFDTRYRHQVFDTLLARLSGSPRGLHKQRGGAELVQHMIRTYREHTPRIALHSDADALLCRLRNSPHKLGLITDGPAQVQWAKIDALALRTCFDAIIPTDELGPAMAKPNPRAFELMARQLRTRADRCTYVADNAGKDFTAPNALGWTTIHIRRADGIYRNSSPAEGGVPRHVIDTLDELDSLLPL